MVHADVEFLYDKDDLEIFLRHSSRSDFLDQEKLQIVVKRVTQRQVRRVHGRVISSTATGQSRQSQAVGGAGRASAGRARFSE